MTNDELEKKAVQVRLDTLRAIHKAGSGHVGANLSLIDILVAMYHGDFGLRKVMNYDATKPGWDAQDYLVLSKKMAAPALYSVLAGLEFFDRSELDYVGQVGSFLKNHPFSKVPGVPVSVKSEGHGLSIAMGLALSLKMERAANKVYAVLDDKELMKGQVWEAASMAAHYKLDNLVAVIDNANLEVDPSGTGEVKVEDIQHKFEAFGWKVIQVTNGHNFDQLLDAFARTFNSVRKPVCIWCHTVAGKGVTFAERKHGYLKANLSNGEMADIIPKLESLV